MSHARKSLRGRLPMTIALVGVAAVWVIGCIWSFTEQRASAIAKGFQDAALLPLVLDGLAASMAGVAYAASLDGRPAVGARLGTAVAVAASAASNGEWAWSRRPDDVATLAIAVGIPIAANIAFEVLLGELRRQVQRKRGLPAPVAVPLPRIVRLLLAPLGTFTAWRRHVLNLTDLEDRGGREHAEEGGPLKTSWDPPTVPIPTLQPMGIPASSGRVDPGIPGRPEGQPTPPVEYWDIDAGPCAFIPRDGERVDPLATTTPPSGGLAASELVNARDSARDGGDPTPVRRDDAAIVAALRDRDPIPGINAIRAEFGVGATRAGRLQRLADVEGRPGTPAEAVT